MRTTNLAFALAITVIAADACTCEEKRPAEAVPNPQANKKQGSVQSRAVTEQELAKSAKRVFESNEASYAAGLSGIGDLRRWSLRWAYWESLASSDNKRAILPYQEHLRRMERLQKKIKASEEIEPTPLYEINYYVLEAKKRVDDAKRKEGRRNGDAPSIDNSGLIGGKPGSP